MPEQNFAPPPGFSDTPPPGFSATPPPGATAAIPAGTPEVPESSPLMFQAPPGFEEAPTPEEGYFVQVKDRVSNMASSLYDAWKKGDLDAMTGLSQTIGGINKQYYETLWKSKDPSEFLINLVPIFGPVFNEALNQSAQGHPQTSAAILTTDLLLPLLAEKLPGAVWDRVPAGLKPDPGKLSHRLMRSALKPTISKEVKKAAMSTRAVNYALQEGIPVSEAGLEKLTSSLAQMNATRDRLIGKAPKPEMVLTPKTPQRAITQGGAADFELGPTVPPEGTQQTVLSHARAERSAHPLDRGTPTTVQFGKVENQNVWDIEHRMGRPGRREPGQRTTFTAETRPGKKPGERAHVDLDLENAANQQLIDDINRRAEESGLLEAIQEQARKAGQPVPYDITEAFNISFKNAIDPKKVAARLDQLKKRYASTNPEAEWAAIDKAKDEFLRNYQQPLSYKQAQAVRTATSRKLKDRAYLNPEQNAAYIESQKVLERAIMEELTDAIPELKALNTKEWKALGLEGELRRAIGRRENWEIWTGIQAGTAAVVGGTVGSIFGMGEGTAAGGAAAVMAMALRDPTIKSKLAIALNRVQQLNPKKYGAPSLAGNAIRINAYHSQLERAAAGLIPAAVVGEANEEEGQP